MIKIIILFCLSVLIGYTSTVIIQPKSLKDIIPGQYIVKLKESVNSRAFVEKEAFRTKDGILTPLKQNVFFVYSTAFNGFAAKLDETQLMSLDSMSEVEYIESDVEIRIDYIAESDVIPNHDEDITQRGATWGLGRISTRQRLTGGGVFDSVWDYNYQSHSGECAVVYVIDTGINIAHLDFGGRAILGASFINGTTAVDDNGHGTHVASTVGGTVYGVAKYVQLVAVKTLSAGGSSQGSSTLMGLDWATQNATSGNNRKPAIFNMSFGGTSNSSVDAVKKAIELGITAVAAAGNNNNDSCLLSPANAPGAITVAASNISDFRAAFSNYGPCVDIYAPGANITGAWIGSTTTLRTISGTSMAAPHVAGLAADYVCRLNLNSPQQVLQKMQQLATPNAINQSDAPMQTPNLLIYYGINAEANSALENNCKSIYNIILVLCTLGILMKI